MNNNYIKLINRFWMCSIEHTFTTSDCMLYFYLLNTCNLLRWKQPFGQSDRYLSMALGVSIPTVRQAKIRLRKRGLIDFKPPEKASRAFEGQTQYLFPDTTEVKRKNARQHKKSKKSDKPTNRKSDIIRLANEAIATCS